MIKGISIADFAMFCHHFKAVTWKRWRKMFERGAEGYYFKDEDGDITDMMFGVRLGRVEDGNFIGEHGTLILWMEGGQHIREICSHFNAPIYLFEGTDSESAASHIFERAGHVSDRQGTMYIIRR